MSNILYVIVEGRIIVLKMLFWFLEIVGVLFYVVEDFGMENYFGLFSGYNVIIRVLLRERGRKERRGYSFVEILILV